LLFSDVTRFGSSSSIICYVLGWRFHPEYDGERETVNRRLHLGDKVPG
jgi:hypothetical protein